MMSKFNKSTDWLTDWLKTKRLQIGLLIRFLKTHRNLLTDWLTDLLTFRVVRWLTFPNGHCLLVEWVDCLSDWLIDCLILRSLSCERSSPLHPPTWDAKDSSSLIVHMYGAPFLGLMVDVHVWQSTVSYVQTSWSLCISTWVEDACPPFQSWPPNKGVTSFSCSLYCDLCVTWTINAQPWMLPFVPCANQLAYTCPPMGSRTCYAYLHSSSIVWSPLDTHHVDILQTGQGYTGMSSSMSHLVGLDQGRLMWSIWFHPFLWDRGKSFDPDPQSLVVA
jgi:hypothetical protein